MSKISIFEISSGKLRLFVPLIKDSALKEYKEVLKRRIEDLKSKSITEGIEELEAKYRLICDELDERIIRDWYE